MVCTHMQVRMYVNTSPCMSICLFCDGRGEEQIAEMLLRK